MQREKYVPWVDLLSNTCSETTSSSNSCSMTTDASGSTKTWIQIRFEQIFIKFGFNSWLYGKILCTNSSGDKLKNLIKGKQRRKVFSIILKSLSDPLVTN